MNTHPAKASAEGGGPSSVSHSSNWRHMAGDEGGRRLGSRLLDWNSTPTPRPCSALTRGYSGSQMGVPKISECWVEWARAHARQVHPHRLAITADHPLTRRTVTVSTFDPAMSKVKSRRVGNSWKGSRQRLPTLCPSNTKVPLLGEDMWPVRARGETRG